MNTRFAKGAYRYFVLWGVLTSLAMTVCTIVDAMLIGNLVGSDGLAVCSFSTPVFLSYALFGITVGVGANVHIARALGASQVEEANRRFRALLGLGLLLGALCWITLLFRPALFRFLGVTQELSGLTGSYLTVVLCSAPLFILYHILSVSVRTDSDPRLAAIASGVVIVTNLLLDLLFMMVFRWGIAGASASLCIAEGLGVATLLLHFTGKRALLKLRLALPKWSDVAAFAANGFGVGSAFIFQALVMLIFNNLLIRFGRENASTYVAIFSVIYTTGMIPFAFYDGAANALTTITAFFLGEADTDSILTVRKQALWIVSVVGFLIAFGCFLFSRQIAVFFGLPTELADGMASLALRIFSASILFTGINTILTAFWQSIGRAWLAGGMSVLRNLVLMLVLGFGFISRGTILGLSMVYFCTEALCCLLALLILTVSPSRNYLKAHIRLPERVFENQYSIRTDSMEQIAGDLERIGEEWAIPMKKTLVINFICEELLLNIIKFGLEDNRKEHYVAIKLMEQEGEHVLRIRDNVRTFNPFETEGDAIDNGVLTLIQKKAQHYDYQRKMIFNYLYMVI